MPKISYPSILCLGIRTYNIAFIQNRCRENQDISSFLPWAKLSSFTKNAGIPGSGLQLRRR